MKIVNLFLLHENTAGQDHSLIFTEFGPQHLEITEMSREMSRCLTRSTASESGTENYSLKEW